MTFMTPDGRALDDAEPQDMARGYNEIFEKLADLIERGGPTPEERDELVRVLRQSASQCRVWAEFGKWPNPSLAPMASFKKYIADHPELLEDDNGEES